MIDFELTEEQLTWRKIARDFSEQEIRPIAERLDRSENLLADFPWEMVRKGSKLGLRTLSLPKEYGDRDLNMLAWLVIMVRIVRDPQFAKEKLLAQSYEPLGSTPEQMGETMKAHFTKYAKMVRDAKIPAE